MTSLPQTLIGPGTVWRAELHQTTPPGSRSGHWDNLVPLLTFPPTHPLPANCLASFLEVQIHEPPILKRQPITGCFVEDMAARARLSMIYWHRSVLRAARLSR